VHCKTLRAGPKSRFRDALSASRIAEGVLYAFSGTAGRRLFRLDSPGLGVTWPEQQRDRQSHMSSTFDVVAKVISDTSEIPLEQITPESHAIDDLGIDSLDFLDIVFALDKKFGIKIPLESWTEEVNEGRAKVEDYFVLKNLCARIDELVAAKAAS
jgi:acyl carrier protein